MPVNTYPLPSGFTKVSPLYQIKVTQASTNYTVNVYRSQAGSCTSTQCGIETNNNFHYGILSFSSPITVTVTKIGSTATQCTIRPNELEVGTLATSTVSGNKVVSFTLNNPSKISIEFNDDPSFHEILMLFGQRLEVSGDILDHTLSTTYNVIDGSDMASISSSYTGVYFAPGIYDISQWTIPSYITHVYLAGGSYVKGYLNKTTSQTLKINGRGVLTGDSRAWHYPTFDTVFGHWYRLINISAGINTIEGITLTEATGPNIYISSNGATVVDNVNIHGFFYNNDGITTFGSGGVTIENCFTSIHDDEVVLYASNTTITNHTSWSLAGTHVQLGWTPHTMSNINVSNWTVLHDKSGYNAQQTYGFISAMNIGATTGSPTNVSNVNISNIYVNTPVTGFLNISGYRNNTDYTLAQSPWAYSNFNFSNIYFNQSGPFSHPILSLRGYGASHHSSNYTFTNIQLNGVEMTPIQISDSTFFTNLYIDNIVLNGPVPESGAIQIKGVNIIVK